MSEAKIRIDGRITGTAWLVHSQHAITAAHCVNAQGSAVELLFANPTTSVYDVPVAATVLVREAILDGALLQLNVPLADYPVLRVICPPVVQRLNWKAQGFPTIAESSVTLFEANGTIGVTAALVQEGNPRVIQLNLNNASSASEERFDVETGAKVHALVGMSGSAVRIHGGAEDGQVIGIIRCSNQTMPLDIIYATPIDVLWPVFEPHLVGVTMSNRIRNGGVVRGGHSPGSIISNIDEEFVVAAWKDATIEQITVDLPWSAACPLIPAILRLVLHQPAISRLHVRNSEAWRGRFLKYAATWITLERFNPTERANPTTELTGTSAEFGDSFNNAAETAETIHFACDRFVLDYVDRRLEAMFEAQDLEPYSGISIAEDVLQQMAITWRANWLPQLRADNLLLHHYLALTVTHQGGHDCIVEQPPGAGPLTMELCIFPATIFSLAIAPFLPDPLIPKGLQPGNLGQDAFTGHSCGIHAVKSRPLDTELRNHGWSTQLVLLPRLQYNPPTWQAARENLLSGASQPRPTLSRPAPSTQIITCDEETRNAISTSVAAVQNHLASRHADQIRREEEYAMKSAPTQ